MNRKVFRVWEAVQCSLCSRTKRLESKGKMFGSPLNRREEKRPVRNEIEGKRKKDAKDSRWKFKFFLSLVC